MQDEFSTEEVQDLWFLVHDKEHAMVRGRHHPTMERACGHFARAAPVLYRGLYAGAEMAWIDGSGELATNGYTSFSEDPAYAARWAKSSGCVLALRNGRAFDYSSWLRTECKKEQDPETRDSHDLDYIEETCDEEREWIVGFPQRFAIVSDCRGRGDLAGHRVVTIVPA